LLLDTVVDGPALDEIVDGITPYPQVLLNVKVQEKPDLLEHPIIGPVVGEVERELDGRGRVVLRYSGTEPKARVMIEGKDQKIVRDLAGKLAGVIERELG
jgi:phosphoglucosamine mutase